MPFYTVNGLRMHIKFGGRGKPPAPCAARVGMGEQTRQCCDISGFLCDWPTSHGKTCDAPLCINHAREVARNRNYCPAHHHQALQPAGDAQAGPQLALFAGLLEAQ